MSVHFNENIEAGRDATFNGSLLKANSTLHDLHTLEKALKHRMSHHENVSGENHIMEKMWFTMSRSDGGPALFTEMPFAYPEFFYSRDIVIICFVFGVPLVAFLILLPTFRKRHWFSVIVVLLCFLSGLGIFCSYVSSSWLVGETYVDMPLGPQKLPTNGTVALSVGLWHANLTYTTTKSHYNYMVTWTDRNEMMELHKMSLEKGWPFALVSLTAELSGEGNAWHGAIGEGMIHAGSMASYALIAAMYSWATWILILLEAPELTCQPLIITGILLAVSALAYIGWGAYYFPSKFILGGRYMMLRFGWGWWIIAMMSILLTVAGVIIMVYDYIYPRRLAAMFKVDFYPHGALVVEASELLHNYENSPETYSQIYPLSLSYIWQGNKSKNSQTLMSETNEDSNVVNHADAQSMNDDTASCKNDESESSRLLLEYVNETGMEPTKESDGNDSMTTESSSIGFGKAEEVNDNAEDHNEVRKRSPPEKNRSEMADSETTVSLSNSYATIRRGRAPPRRVSVPIIVPQVSPKVISGPHKKSLSRIHSKYRPAYSPRKPSMENLLDLPKLDLEDAGENVTYL